MSGADLLKLRFILRWKHNTEMSKWLATEFLYHHRIIRPSISIYLKKILANFLMYGTLIQFQSTKLLKTTVTWPKYVCPGVCVVLGLCVCPCVFVSTCVCSGVYVCI